MNYQTLKIKIFWATLLLKLFLISSSILAFSPDDDYIRDREALDVLEKQAFLYTWEDSDPNSGTTYEANFGWEVRPVSVGGTGFGIIAIVVAVDRNWITREQAVGRLLKITRFFQNTVSRPEWHGAFPHWLNGQTGEIFDFGDGNDVIDTVETSLLMQGLLIARAYFNGPGAEEELRTTITELWKNVDWNWFTDGQENGIFWHWSPKRGFLGLRIKGYNECLITYVLAAASPTHPISRRAYNYWTSGEDYKPKTIFGYRIEASPLGSGPLFLAQYSFIGLDPHHLADKFVTHGYFVRNLTQTLINRSYCLWTAPPQNRYTEDFWGLSASQIQNGGYAASDPNNDHGIIAPTAALSSLPYTPHYSLQVLHNLRTHLKDKVWNFFGPRDAISLRDNWVSPHYLAVNQLPIVAMVENYRTGLLWKLLMSDPEVRTGLNIVGLYEPKLEEGFPEAVVTLKKENRKIVADAYEIRRHPDSGLYVVPYWCAEAGPVHFTVADPNQPDGQPLLEMTPSASAGRNYLYFSQFRRNDGIILTLTMTTLAGGKYNLPLRLH
ncbi:MAG: beta-glucosidase [Candidatus Adiutrix intracellularis]|jgi:hypothetical protein|nr:beta-glucosidase [Candidatus Adiutrix intracellularis]